MTLRDPVREGFLRYVFLFADCTAEELARIAPMFEPVELEEGDELVHEGHHGEISVLIVDGTAEVRRHGEVVRTIGPGDFVGEISLVADGTRTATVVATSPVEVLVMPNAALERVAGEVPSIRAKLESLAQQRLLDDRGLET